MINPVLRGLKGIFMNGVLSDMKGNGIMLVYYYDWEVLPSWLVISGILFEIQGENFQIKVTIVPATLIC